MEARKCDECDKVCAPINIHSAPEQSEWYCEPCHKSYPMDLSDAKVLNGREVEIQMAKRGRR